VLARSFGAASVGWFWWTCQPSCFLSGPYDFHTDQWAALYTKRIDAMIAALKSKGVPVIWVGMGNRDCKQFPVQQRALYSQG
jgi:hypothetical protein